jgi:hypothetical protein
VKSIADTLSQRIEQLEESLRQQSPSVGISSTRSAPDQTQYHTQPDTPPGSNGSSVNEETPTDQDSVVRKIMPQSVRFDLASGRVRCFGPTTAMHLLHGTSLNKASQNTNTHWPICMVVPGLSPATNEYLLGLFWNCHNDTIHLVHRFSFYEDQERGGQFYSTFLHLCMLAMGLRYADKNRSDVTRLLTRDGSSSSILHEKARQMAKLELEQPGAITAIQAFLTLADLECCSGKDDTGWMFAGMAFRLLFDVGLHVVPESMRLSEKEGEIRHMVLWACIFYDKYWSLYLGRPSSIKTADIAPSCLSQDFGPLISCGPSGKEKRPATVVYEALLRLMDLVGPLCNFDTKRTANTTEEYFKIAAVDRELNNFYNSLPEELHCTPQNVQAMPWSLSLLQ